MPPAWLGRRLDAKTSGKTRVGVNRMASRTRRGGEFFGPNGSKTGKNGVILGQKDPGFFHLGEQQERGWSRRGGPKSAKRREESLGVWVNRWSFELDSRSQAPRAGRSTNSYLESRARVYSGSPLFVSISEENDSSECASSRPARGPEWDSNWDRALARGVNFWGDVSGAYSLRQSG